MNQVKLSVLNGTGGASSSSNNNNNGKSLFDSTDPLLNSNLLSSSSILASPVKPEESRVLIVSEEKDILQSYPFPEFLEMTKYFKKKTVIIDEQTLALSPSMSHLFKENDDGNPDEPSVSGVKKSLMDRNLQSSPVSNLKRKSFKPLWIDLGGIKDHEIVELGRELHIHPLTIEDILSNETSEKCELYPEYLFVSTSELQYSPNGDLKEVRFYMILYSEFILVFHSKQLTSFEFVLQSFRYLPKSTLPSSDWVLCSYFEAINETFTHYAEQLLKEVQTLDDFTLNEDSVEYKELYVRIGRASRRSTNLLGNLFIKNDILSSLIRQSLHKESLRYLSNIKDRTIRLQQNLKLIEQLLENVQNTYISKVSLLLNEESHSLNLSMKNFGIISLLFLPMNFIAGLFGMNVRIPGMINFLNENQSGVEFFYIILASMILLALLVILTFKKVGWLD